MLPGPDTHVRLEPIDELMHENTGEARFNESMYFNFYDASARRGGFARIGNRPNEGHAEVTLCLFEPDGSVLFQYLRPEIRDNAAFDAGGMRFEVERPFELLRVAYDGPACHLRDPLAMEDPRAAFRDNPFAPVRLELRVEGAGPVYGGEAGGTDELEFARGHYEQHHRSSGWIEVAGERRALEGFGLRDHSWGPRSWQAPAAYRWLTASFGADFGFVGSWIARRDGGLVQGGFVHRSGRRILVRGVEVKTRVSAGTPYPERIEVQLDTEGDGPLTATGRRLAVIPLRNRRDGRVTRICETLTEWHCEGRTGYGLSEYLDQVTPEGQAEQS